MKCGHYGLLKPRAVKSNPNSCRTCFPIGLFTLILSIATVVTGSEVDRNPSKYPYPFQSSGPRESGEFSQNVNLLDGSVSVGIPLGSIKTAGGWDFQLRLSYNSNLWNVRQKVHFYDDGNHEAVRTSEFQYSPIETQWLHNARFPIGPLRYGFIPIPFNGWGYNVAPGWLLDPGRILEVPDAGVDEVRYIFATGDHDRIALFHTLHHGDSGVDGADPRQDGVYFSRNGSYLKFVEMPAGDPLHGEPASGYLYLPNGHKVRFEYGSFAYQEDPFGNRVSKTIVPGSSEADAANGVFFGPKHVYVDNTFGRTIKVGFASKWGPCDPAACPNGYHGLGDDQMVEWVEVQVPGLDGSGQPNTYRYQLNQCGGAPLHWPDFCHPDSPNYNQATCDNWLLSQIPASCAAGFEDSQCIADLESSEYPSPYWIRHNSFVPPGRNNSFNLFILGEQNFTSGLRLDCLELPDGSDYRFSYGAYSEVNGGPSGVKSGAIKEIQLPQGGRISYTYGIYHIPDNRPVGERQGDAFESAHYWGGNMGVTRVDHIDRDGTPLGTWRYQRGVTDFPNNTDGYLGAILDESSQNRDVFVRVTSPSGNDSVHYFRTRDNTWDYGAPFTRARAISNAFPGQGDGDIRQAYLSLEVFDGPAVVNGQKGNLVRSRFVTYVRDVRGAGEPNSKFNQRMIYERTVYHDDSVGGTPRYADLFYSDFDGFGNFRKVRTGGNFGAGDVVETYFNFNGGNGTYAVYETAAGGDDGSTFAFGVAHNFIPPDPSLWLWTTYTSRTLTEGGQIAKTEFEMDANRGHLLKRRTLRSFDGTRSPNDLVETLSYDGKGRLLERASFGADRQNNLPLTALNAINFETRTPEYVESYRFDDNLGTVETILENPVRNEILRKSLRTFDRHTGLTTREEGADGVATIYEYDALSRVTKNKVGSDAPTTLAYYPATFQFNAKIIDRQGTGAAGNSVSQTLNGFGQLKKEKVETSDGTVLWKSTYGEGHLKKVERPHFQNQPATFTEVLHFDPFDFPTLTRLPDGNLEETVVIGRRLHDIRRQIATGQDGTQSTSRTVHILDRQGRLIKVRQYFQDGVQFVDTGYNYDVLGNIVTVSQGNQTRSFLYDGRGFLVSKNDPESGTSHYSALDTRGQPGSTSNGGRQIFYRYDGYGRLVQVKDEQGRLLKDYFFAASNRGSSKSAGKLVQSRRFNYLTRDIPGLPNPIVVTGTYFYRDGSGRNTHYRVRTNSGVNFDQSVVFDDMGQIRTQNYPALEIGDFPRAATVFGPDQHRSLQFTFEKAKMTSIPGWVSNIEYHASGLRKTTSRANLVSDVVGLDPHLMARPASVETEGADADWVSGDYLYDGSGNVKATGSDQFSYDALGRLTWASYSEGLVQNFSYDQYGNLKQIGDRVLSVDGATNRLNGAGSSYDDRGNLLTHAGRSFLYDDLDHVAEISDDRGWRVFVYDADERRLATFFESGEQRWTPRATDGTVMRVYELDGGGKLQVGKDYVYAGQLIGSYDYRSGKSFHHHRDHLGSLRMISDEDGRQTALIKFLPFGAEIELSSQESETMKFAGHERDADDLDYMRSRYYLPEAGRFTAVDPAAATITDPQSWNRYHYVTNNPINAVDPEGEQQIPVFYDEITVVQDADQPIDGPTLKEAFDHFMNTEFVEMARLAEQPVITSQANYWRGVADRQGWNQNIWKDFLIGFTLSNLPNSPANDFKYHPEAAPHLMLGQITGNLAPLGSRKAIRANAYGRGTGSSRPDHPTQPRDPQRIEVAIPSGSKGSRTGQPAKSSPSMFQNNAKGDVIVRDRAGAWRVISSLNPRRNGTYSLPPVVFDE